MSIFKDVFTALVDGFDGIKLTSGKVLSSTTRETEALPRLVWTMSSWQSTDWQPFVYKVDWSLPATLRVQGESGDATPIQEAIADLYNWADQIKGLPHLDSLEVIPFSPRQLDLGDAGKLLYFGDQFVGPIIESTQVQPGAGDNTFAQAKLTLSVSFLVSYEPETVQRVRLITVGANIGGVAGPSTPYDRSRDYTVAPPVDADTQSWTGFRTPGPMLYASGTAIDQKPYPLQPDIPGIDYDFARIGQVVIAPLVATVAALATNQLQAIGICIDGSTVNLSGSAAWASSAPTKATVSATGLVAGVASGVAVITATFGTLAGTAAITVP
jgi:hypothetical protein